jgi:hypothetical protein
MMPSAFCGVGCQAVGVWRARDGRRARSSTPVTSQETATGPLLGHQLDRPATFGRPCAIAMFDCWCVFPIAPCPNSPATLSASVDRFRRADHTISGYSSVGDEAVNDPNRPLTREGPSRRVLVRFRDRPVATFTLVPLDGQPVPGLGPRLRRAGTWVRISLQMVSTCEKVCWLVLHQLSLHLDARRCREDV